MKSLPYFRWYPADAEGDDFYASLTDAEGWTFTRLLNRSWMNDGIPADLADMGRAIGRTPIQMEKVWPKLKKRWVMSPRDPAKLVNPRQEIERAIAIKTSENNKRVGNANASKTRLPGNANTPQHARARAESVCVSVSSSSKRGSGGDWMSHRFSEWLQPWLRCANPDTAARAWTSTVLSPEDEAAAFAARDRYLGSDEVARGAIMEPAKFLFAQRDCQWSGKWLPRREKRASSVIPNGVMPAATPAETIEALRWLIESPENPATEAERAKWRAELAELEGVA